MVVFPKVKSTLPCVFVMLQSTRYWFVVSSSLAEGNAARILANASFGRALIVYPESRSTGCAFGELKMVVCFVPSSPVMEMPSR